MLSDWEWSTQVGIDTLKCVVSQHIPQWTTGLHTWQLETIPIILTRQNLFAIAATGEGKSALYIVPILVHLELSKKSQSYPSFVVRDHPVVIVVAPTKALSKSIIRELEQFGLSGLSYCHTTITKYRIKLKKNLEQLITECNTWNLICIDPEHLASPEWARIIENKTFQSNLTLFTVDEAHLIPAWGCVPDHVPILALTATLAIGTSTTSICQSLGFLGDSYNLIRHSNEHINMQIILQPLRKLQGVSKYAQLLDYLCDGRKTVIHVNTIPEAYGIYEFLWDYIQNEFDHLQRMWMFHSLCPDDYNQQTFDLIDSDPYLQVVIATTGFTQGVNQKMLLDSILFGFPDTIDDFWQAKGRVGRDPNTICRGTSGKQYWDNVPQQYVQRSTQLYNCGWPFSYKAWDNGLPQLFEGEKVLMMVPSELTGRGNVIKGWNEDIPQLSLGQQAMLTVHPVIDFTLLSRARVPSS
ncbi:P-loop containing nucleoside triphosphate hydrolase protein [Dendrothele bispora CBS 962.96]|uniref:P-loop containing nucleoside triphosphate hydrolase protein n=1 Tax=Dendrothele bispora (strain CBS 962.96) TaxID=1314807 RepID=A0A4S8MMM5_DENBC|nr:P-loop containing nucleoside triphosphate hydrolase protein [Dendrothele bispora CBS 962.96]